jgi:hypothetical protein
MCRYRLKRSIIPLPHSEAEPISYEIENSKLSTGGRYLFFIDKTTLHDRQTYYRTIRILDLENEDKCVWSYCPCDEINPADPSFVDFDEFKFELQRDGSILLILRVFDMLSGERDVGR